MDLCLRRWMHRESWRRSEENNPILSFSNLLVILLVAILLGSSGCEAFTRYGAPQLAVTATSIVLSLQEIRPDESEDRFVFFIASRNDPTSWKRFPPRLGRVIALLPEGERIQIVFSDGTVGGWEGETFIPPKSSLEPIPLLVHATRIHNTLVTVGRSAEGDVALFQYENDPGRWLSLPPPPFLVRGMTSLLLTEFQGEVALLGAMPQGNFETVRIVALVHQEGEWQILPALPSLPATRVFTSLGTGNHLLLLRESLDSVRSSSPLLYPALFQNGVWKTLPSLPLSEGKEPLGMAAALEENHLYLVRADEESVSLYTAKDLEEKDWRLLATPVRQHRYGIILILSFFSALALGSILYGVIRYRNVAPFSFPPRWPGSSASPIERAMAFLIDFLLLLPLPYAFVQEFGMPWLSSSQATGLVFLLTLGGLSLYATLTEARWGQTFGKYLFSIRVRSARGGPITPFQALLRNLARGIDFFPIPVGEIVMPYLIALIVVLLTPRRQRLGDLLASTLVLRHVPLSSRFFLLASASPRRRDLFAALGLRFEIEDPTIEERIRPDESPEEAVCRLAQEKVEAVANRRMFQGEIVIGADTLVLLDGIPIGKPANEEDARQILRRLSGRIHEIITGVAIFDRATGQALVASERTEVEMKTLSEEEIDAYIATGEGMDCAGAYAIQGKAGSLIVAVYGSLSNVIGLPLELLQRMLQELDG